MQSLLPGCPLDLVEEGKKLSVEIQPLLREAKSASTSSKMESATNGRGSEIEDPLVPLEADIVTRLLELCPACGVEVLLEDITSAVCQDGHTWGTSFLSSVGYYFI